MDHSSDVNISWQLPIKYDFDILVIGGGPAGIAAAVASSRQQMNTGLIERYGFLGGMSTSALVGPFMSCYDTKGKTQIVRGIYQELIEIMVNQGGAVDPSQVAGGSDYVSFIEHAHHNAVPFDPEVMKYTAMELVLDAGVKVKLHTQFVRSLAKHEKIEYVVLLDKSGLCLAKAKQFIDATGDGDVAASAGNPFEKGRPEDGKTQPATMFMRIGNVNDQKVCEWLEERKKSHPNEIRWEYLVSKAKQDGNWPEGLPQSNVAIYRQPRKGEWRVNTSRVLGVDGTDPESLTWGEIHGRRQVIGLIKFFNQYMPGCEHAYLIDTGAQIGIRETRRITGKYVLSREDVQQAKTFPDAIARTAFFVDVHNPAGAGQESGVHPRQYVFIEGDFFEIPYRCLVPSFITNLLTAGRCISADHWANGAIRIMPTCFATGQAAGMAAAIAIQENTSPSLIDVLQLRTKLKESNCYL